MWMKDSFLRIALILGILSPVLSYKVYSQEVNRIEKNVLKKLKTWENPLNEWKHIGKLRIDSVRIPAVNKNLNLYFSPTLSYYPIREDIAALFVQSLVKSLGSRFRKYKIEVFSNGYPLHQLIPNIYRSVTPVDSSRIQPVNKDKKVLVRNLKSTRPGKGLEGNSIALWHSHGYFFEMNLDRWEWQRARLFGTVEDISVMGYVLPYLTRMLENSGANVFLPRERDIQTNEVIVDNDRSTGTSEVVLHLNNKTEERSEGFMLLDTLFAGINPFKKGTSFRILNDTAVYIPQIPADGDYAVYVSYPRFDDNSNSVKYTVSHSGGKTELIVDQTIGGETWIYLGSFRFKSGKDEAAGSVMVSNSGKPERYIGLDAIKFGGGMGNVARRPSADIIKNQRSVNEGITGSEKQEMNSVSDFTWKLSGKPRYAEGSRYWLQYAGMSDSLIYSPNFYKNDYNDDYQSRGFWVNFLTGNPSGTGTGIQAKGLGIPIDLSVAFHTDAGITKVDSIIGTLGIYSTGADNGKFPDGSSRMASRDLTDIIQTQVVNDIREMFNPEWTRRGIWDKPYSEARRPNVPAILLELLSHQNKADQQFGLDPRFRFQVSRSIYKGILKYQAYVENRGYVVQPLPVTDFAIIPLDGKRIRLSWEPVIDKSEPTSASDRYKVYMRTGDNGFDNGIIVSQPSVEIELENYDTIFSFRVTAINDGGESFESEILSAGLKSGDSKKVLVVNGFNRISGPEWFERAGLAGVAWWKDRGVADHYEISQVGDQYDFDRKSLWLDDDAPGWGASWADMEGKVIPGNSFDYPFIHGKAIMAAGRSFVSVSDEYFCSDKLDNSGFDDIDLIFGEEKATPFVIDTTRTDYKIYTPQFMQKISELTQRGTNIFMSGAYVGSELQVPGDSTAIKFAGQYLHITHRTDHAVNRGEVYAIDYAKSMFTGNYTFNTDYSEKIYSVESPGAIEPAGKGAICSFRYSQNNTSAGVIYRGSYKTVVLGFPFETILSEKERNALMGQILKFFEK